MTAKHDACLELDTATGYVSPTNRGRPLPNGGPTNVALPLSMDAATALAADLTAPTFAALTEPGQLWLDLYVYAGRWEPRPGEQSPSGRLLGVHALHVVVEWHADQRDDTTAAAIREAVRKVLRSRRIKGFLTEALAA
ncbi:hypothetical protein ABLE94_02525 [Gordonia sp. VNK1]|uniref:hypothetical protein n=1 Tax=Gordonia oleivorans TaxID=3156618 RepID=UPI0032B4CAEC